MSGEFPEEGLPQDRHYKGLEPMSLEQARAEAERIRPYIEKYVLREIAEDIEASRYPHIPIRPKAE